MKYSVHTYTTYLSLTLGDVAKVNLTLAGLSVENECHDLSRRNMFIAVKVNLGQRSGVASLLLILYKIERK